MSFEHRNNSLHGEVCARVSLLVRQHDNPPLSELRGAMLRLYQVGIISSIISHVWPDHVDKQSKSIRLNRGYHHLVVLAVFLVVESIISRASSPERLVSSRDHETRLENLLWCRQPSKHLLLVLLRHIKEALLLQPATVRKQVRTPPVNGPRCREVDPTFPIVNHFFIREQMKPIIQCMVRFVEMLVLALCGTARALAVVPPNLEAVIVLLEGVLQRCIPVGWPTDQSQAGHVRAVLVQNEKGSQMHLCIGLVPYPIDLFLFKVELVVAIVMRLFWVCGILSSCQSIDFAPPVLIKNGFEECLGMIGWIIVSVPRGL